MAYQTTYWKINDVELQLNSCKVVTRAPATLPFLVEDASRSEAEIADSQSTERPFASVSQEARLAPRRRRWTWRLLPPRSDADATI